VEEKRCRERKARLEAATRPLPAQLQAARQEAGQVEEDVTVLVSPTQPMLLGHFREFRSRSAERAAANIGPSIRQVTVCINLADGYPICAHNEIEADFRQILLDTLTKLSAQEKKSNDGSRATLLEAATYNVDKELFVVGARLAPSVVKDDSTTRSELEQLFGSAVMEVTADPTLSPLNFRERLAESGPPPNSESSVPRNKESPSR
jgi:hypothetical protein